MKHVNDTMKFTARYSGRFFRKSTISLLITLTLLLAGPADAREFASFELKVEQGVDVWGSSPASTQIKEKMTQVETPVGMFLQTSYFQNEFNGEGAACFPDSGYTGWFVVKQERDGSALVNFYFQAYATDDNPQVDDPHHKYVLHLFGAFYDPDGTPNPDNFPPAKDTTIVMFAPAWEMSTEGKGQERKVTCRGEGVFSTEVTVTVKRTG